MISISGTGKIAKEFDVTVSKSGNPYVRLSITTMTSKKGADGKNLYEFMTLFVGETKSIEYLTKYCNKGSTIEFYGKFEPNKYKNKEGMDVSGYTVTVNEITTLTMKDDDLLTTFPPSKESVQKPVIYANR